MGRPERGTVAPRSAESSRPSRASHARRLAEAPRIDETPRKFAQTRLIDLPAPEEGELPMMRTTRRTPKLDLPAKKAKLLAWVEENRIPGKVQSWLSVPSTTQSGDWRLVAETRGAHRMLMLEPPAPGVRPPDCILAMDEQLRKEHLKPLRRQLLQIIFRATGDGRYGMLVHAILRTPEATHALKTWLDFLQRNHPEVLSCHIVQTKPWFPFDPADPPVAMKFTLKQGFGSEYLPIGTTGLFHHILDWAPRTKSTWLAWPERLRAAIHPVKGDRLLVCHSGPALEGLSLANSFQDVHCMDSRQWAHSSWMHNIHAAGLTNVSFHQDKLEEKWVNEFFSKAGREGKWTILLNPAGSEQMSAGTVIAIAQAKPERIVHVLGDLTNAAKEVKRWRRGGYVLRKILPLDWNPDASRFEIAMLFVPDRAGLLGRKIDLENPVAPVRPREEPKAPTPRFVQPKTRGRSGKV